MRLKRISRKRKAFPPSLFRRDLGFEEQTIAYLKSTPIPRDIGIRNYCSFDTEPELQYRGTDFQVIDSSGIVRNVDAKAIASRNIATFSFEISGIESTGQLGWFINPKVKTDDYLLMCLEPRIRAYFPVSISHRERVASERYLKSRGMPERMSMDDYSLTKQYMRREDIISSEVMYISKDSVMRIIHDELGLDLDGLKRLIPRLRELSNESRTKGILTYRINEGEIIEKRKDEKNINVYFSVSTHLSERPINVIIKKHLLRRHSSKIYNLDHTEQWKKSRTEFFRNLMKESDNGGDHDAERVFQA